jgi:hypothetical protein
MITYSIYWLLTDGTKLYHADTVTGAPWLFYSYDSMYEVAQRLPTPQGGAQLMFHIGERPTSIPWPTI